MTTKDNDLVKLPRVYTTQDLGTQKTVTLDKKQAHYVVNVMRRGAGDNIRLFNGRDGEWLGLITDTRKKSVSLSCENQIRPQTATVRNVHLYFAPIRKSRLIWLIEKSVELGATHLHPMLSRNTETRKINREKTLAYITGAAEQSERLDLPKLAEIKTLDNIIPAFGEAEHMIVCLERDQTRPPLPEVLPPADSTVHIMIGPEGGFTTEERDLFLKSTGIKTAALGPRTLRCETAVCAALSAILLQN